MPSPDNDSPFLKDLEALRQQVQEQNLSTLREVSRLELRYAAAPALGKLKPLVPITLGGVFSVAPQVDTASPQSWGEQAVAHTQALGRERSRVATTHDLNLSALRENQLILEALRKMLIEAGAPIGLDLSPLLKAMPVYFNDGFDDAVKGLDAFEQGIVRFRESTHRIGLPDSSAAAAPVSAPAEQTPSSDLPVLEVQRGAPWAPKFLAPDSTGFPTKAPRTATPAIPVVPASAPVPAPLSAPSPAPAMPAAREVAVCRTADSGSIRRPVREGVAPVAPAVNQAQQGLTETKVATSPEAPPGPRAHQPSVFNTRSGQRKLPATSAPTPARTPAPEPPVVNQSLARMARVYSADNATPEKVLNAITRSNPMVRMSIWLTLCEQGHGQYLPLLRGAVQEFTPQNNQGMGIKEELTVILERASLEGVEVFKDLAFPVALLSNNLPSSVKRDVEELIPLLLQ